MVVIHLSFSNNQVICGGLHWDSVNVLFPTIFHPVVLAFVNNTSLSHLHCMLQTGAPLILSFFLHLLSDLLQYRKDLSSVSPLKYTSYEYHYELMDSFLFNTFQSHHYHYFAARIVPNLASGSSSKPSLECHLTVSIYLWLLSILFHFAFSLLQPWDQTFL